MATSSSVRNINVVANDRSTNCTCLVPRCMSKLLNNKVREGGHDSGCMPVANS
jgi:hypothetical protein